MHVTSTMDWGGLALSFEEYDAKGSKPLKHLTRAEREREQQTQNNNMALKLLATRGGGCGEKLQLPYASRVAKEQECGRAKTTSRPARESAARMPELVTSGTGGFKKKLEPGVAPLKGSL